MKRSFSKTWGEWSKLIKKVKEQNPDLREGQAVVLALKKIDKSIAIAYHGSLFDPFENDSRVSDYISRILAEWRLRYESEAEGHAQGH